MHWWNSLFHKDARYARVDSELRFHIDKLTEENIAAGMAPDEARRQAALEFGGREQLKEEVRDVYRIGFVETSLANLKSAFRFIRKSPGFSIAVILTLALGIGANSAVFSAIDAIILRPLPFPDGDQLMRLAQANLKIKGSQPFVSPARLEDWNSMNSTFQAMTGYYTENASEISGLLPEKVTEASVAPRFFQVWGIAPELGRDFVSAEEHTGGPAALIISSRFWHRRFSGDPNVIGKKLRFAGASIPIVGVMPASFLFANKEVDLWFPIPYEAASFGRDARWYTVIGRLKPGVTVSQARADLATVQSQLGKAYPQTDRDLSVSIEPLKETTIQGATKSLWLLFGAVTLLLLIACTNIVALLLSRAAQRQHEISVRFSLGASRGAVIWQLLTEAFVLAVAGSALGLVIAAGTSSIFRALAKDLPRVEEIHLDVRIVLYALACSVAATILCGFVPAIRGTRNSISASLAQASRNQVSGRHPLQWSLVGLQVALAVTLLAGAGLLVRSFQALGRVSPGFEMSHILTFHISGSWGETVDMKGLTQRIQRTIETFRNVPGIEGVATASALPGVPGKYQTEVKVMEGEQDPERKIVAESRFVSPGYFATLRIPLLEGEVCREDPSLPSGTLTAMVNRDFADKFLGGSAAVGHHVQLPGAYPLEREISGVVGDAREQGLNRAPGPTVYWCGSAPVPDPFYIVRTSTAPMAMAETLRQSAHQIEPTRSVFDMMPLEEHLNDAFAENRMRTILLSFFAVTAISLACIGLYGTLSYSVNVRKREIGLRLALGSRQGQVLEKFLLQGLRVALLGCVAGCSLALALSRVLAGMLYGVSPWDATTLVMVVSAVLLVAALASLLPAMRAARVDPMRVLREE